MLEHADIWLAVDRLAHRQGLSASGLARRAGLDPTTFNPSKRRTAQGKLRWPSTESISKILMATGCTLADFVALIGAVPDRRSRHVPIIGYAQAGTEGFFDDAGYPLGTGWDEVVFPDIGDPNAYALEITGDSMEPVYRAGDTIVMSSAPIPGNEELINRTIDNLFRLGADVIYSELAHVHVSGHGSREDHKMMINLVHPKYFIPIHGEYRHLVLHSRLAAAMGIPEENIWVIESGQVMEFGPDGVFPGELVTEGHVLVDGLGVGDIGHVVLRDRRHLSRDGFVVAVAMVDQASGQLVGEPEILTRGVVYVRDSEELLERARTSVRGALVHAGPPSALSTKVKDALTELIYKETGRRPMVLPVVLEV